MTSDKERICGCGRAAVEVATFSTLLGRFERDIKLKEKNKIPLGALWLGEESEQMYKDTRSMIKGELLQWISGLRSECGLNEAEINKIRQLVNDSPDDVIGELRQIFVKCAGMTQ